MSVRFHPHALQRLRERGATRAEVVYPVERGRNSPAKFGRTRFTLTFAFNRKSLDRIYRFKRVETFATRIGTDNWLVITVIVNIFEELR